MKIHKFISLAVLGILVVLAVTVQGAGCTQYFMVVLEGSGDAVEGADIILTHIPPVSPGGTITTTSGSDGRASITLTEGSTYSVFARKGSSLLSSTYSLLACQGDASNPATLQLNVISNSCVPYCTGGGFDMGTCINVEIPDYHECFGGTCQYGAQYFELDGDECDDLSGKYCMCHMTMDCPGCFENPSLCTSSGCVYPGIFPTTPQKSYDSLFDAYWSNVFMVTPFLEDTKTELGWTKVGNGTLYHGSGFYRSTTCKFGCDAKGECDMLDTCSISRKGASSACGGPGTDECSHCIADSPTAHCEEDESDCTVVKLTPTMLPGREILGEKLAGEEDCFRICKIEPRGYRLEAPVEGSFYGIPYEGKCPKGFDGVKNIIVSYNYPSWNNKPTTEKKCILEGGVLGLSNFTIPDTEIDDGSDAEWDSGVKMTHIITHPAFTLIETGNMPFEIVWAGVSESDDYEYSVKRLYKPQDHSKEFVVNSDLVFNYILLDSAKELKIEAKHTYITLLRTDIHRVACDEQVVSPEECTVDNYCSCSWHVSKEPTYQDFIRRGACGGTSVDRYSYCWYGCGSCEGDSPCCCGCPGGSRVDVKERIEKETLPPTRSIRTLEQEVIIPKVSHEKLVDNTQVEIDGIIDQYVDEYGSREISGVLEVTLDPDILGMFIVRVNNSAIRYSPVVYPVKHYLYRKYASPGDEIMTYDHTDTYGYESTRFGFPEQCKEVCPAPPTCFCPPEDPLDVTCRNLNDGSLYKRTNCSCAPNECYPDPCRSNRSFHEEQGLRIRNGEFERSLCYCPRIPPFTGEKECDCGSPLSKYREYKNWKAEGTVTWPVSGFSGHGIRLEKGGSIKQRIAPVPLHILPYNKTCFMYALEECESGGYLIVRVNGERKLRISCDDYGPCDLPSGWTKACVDLNPLKNISSIEFKTSERKEIKVRLDNVNLGDYYDFVSVYTTNISAGSKFYGVDYREHDYTGLLMVDSYITQDSVDDKTKYSFNFTILKLNIMNSSGESEEYTMPAEEIRKTSNITLFSHFRNITIPLFPSPALTGNPKMDVIIREATRIDYEFDRDPLSIEKGVPVTCTLTLTEYDTKNPVASKPIYITSVYGKTEFLSPPSLADVKAGETGYVTTDASGKATLTFKLGCADQWYVDFPGDIVTKLLSPTRIMPIVSSSEFRSPFFKGEFLSSFMILILILVFTLLSYRFFRGGKVDLGQWWRDLRGGEEE